MINKQKAGLNNSIHSLLAHSYVVYFLFLLIGLLFNIIHPIHIYNSKIIIYIGFIFLIFSTFLIIWAQKTTRNLDKNNLSIETFSQGPYRYTYMPTQAGLFFLMLGFGLILNSSFIVFFSFLSFFISKIFFLRKEEEILVKKYGAPYIEYKKSVRF